MRTLLGWQSCVDESPLGLKRNQLPVSGKIDTPSVQPFAVQMGGVVVNGVAVGVDIAAVCQCIAQKSHIGIFGYIPGGRIV